MTDPNIYDIELNIDNSMANSLRRIMISKIPSIVIYSVCITENDSSMSDEMIAHRLGQIPLKKLDDSENTEYTMSLSEIGPKTIYSRDIVFSNGIKVVDPNIILIKLDKGVILKFNGFTKEGNGEEHAKYSVCCGTSYKKINDNLYKIHVESCGNYTAKDIFIKSLDILKNDLLMYKNIK
jgi:DNA-directed RNA polymerase subunit D